jgi:hypothetical protein
MRGKFHLRRCLIALTLVLLVSSCAGSAGQAAPFQDSFDNPRSGWGEDQRDEFERGYENDEYFIELYTPDWFAWARSGKQLDDVSVETNVYLASGAPDGHFGVLCRYVNADNFYYFAISADGYYAIFSRVDGEMGILTGNGSGMIPSPAIKTGGEVNRITAVCRGNELSFSVNGQLLDTVTDRDHARGDVGLGAGSGPAGSALVRFDDFSMTAP